MLFHWTKKQKDIIVATEEHEQHSYIEVVELKKQAHQSITEADKHIKSLNALLRADGITLKIHIAAGGHRGH